MSEGVPPSILDTSAFAPASRADIESAALGGRSGLRLVEVAGGRLRARVLGEGETTVVCLPDGPNTIEHLDELADGLVADGHRVVLLEIPGFGYSWVDDPALLTFEGTVAAVGAALGQLAAPGRTVLSGVCVQAHVALGVVAADPAVADALLLLQAADWAGMLRWGGEVLDPQRVLRVPWSGQVSWRLDRERLAVDGWYAAAAGPDAPLEEWRRRARAVVRGPSTYALASLLQNWRAMDPPALTPPAGMPVTVAWGEADRTHRCAGTDGRGLLEHVPGARHETWNGVGHFADVEAPERFRGAVRDLLEQLGS